MRATPYCNCSCSIVSSRAQRLRRKPGQPRDFAGKVRLVGVSARQRDARPAADIGTDAIGNHALERTATTSQHGKRFGRDADGGRESPLQRPRADLHIARDIGDRSLAVGGRDHGGSAAHHRIETRHIERP